MMDKRKEKQLAIMLTIGLILMTAGFGYAFFLGSVSNENNEKYSTNTSKLSLKFSDNDAGINKSLNLGESITKKFIIENTGTLDAYAKINWSNLVNTYTKKSLSYKLEEAQSENGSYTIIKEGNVPTSETKITAVLKTGIIIPVNSKKYYKLTITLNNLDINQNSDINATFYTNFTLEDGSLTGADKILNLVRNANPNSTNVINAENVSNECTNTLAYDGTDENNLRYVGANPCNYVTFNNEPPTIEYIWVMRNTADKIDMVPPYESEEACLADYEKHANMGVPMDDFICVNKRIITKGWRIVGVMNNVDDGTGKRETRLKLIRNELLGEYAWDSSVSSINNGNGVNDWVNSNLMSELNGDYLNTSLTENTLWYDYHYDWKRKEYDYTKGLNQTAQNMVGNTKWHLGGVDGVAFKQDAYGKASDAYISERGTTVWGSTSGQTCNDGACPRATSWTGKVGLVYLSDYGFAVGGNVRDTCLTKAIFNYDKSNCGSENWMKSEFNYSLTITPASTDVDVIAIINGREGDISFGGTAEATDVYPSVYLKSSVDITGGNGTIESPYILK